MNDRYRRYMQTEKGKAAIKRAKEKYRKSEKGKIATTKYLQSEKGKATMQRYLQSEKGKETLHKYRHSINGRLQAYKNTAKWKHQDAELFFPIPQNALELTFIRLSRFKKWIIAYTEKANIKLDDRYQIRMNLLKTYSAYSNTPRWKEFVDLLDTFVIEKTQISHISQSYTCNPDGTLNIVLNSYWVSPDGTVADDRVEIIYSPTYTGERINEATSKKLIKMFG